MDQRIEQFLGELKLEGRSSPAGLHWDRFYEFLQSRKTSDEDDPPVPFILGASGESNTRKHERLSQQLEWASRNGILAEAIQYLRETSVKQWNRGALSDWDKDTYG